MICALEAVRRWQAPNQYAPADHSLEHHSTFHFADTSSTAKYGRLLQQQGIPILAIFNAPTGQLNGGEASGDYFFILPVPPTALVCFHDLMATRLMHVIRAKIYDPRQLFAGFDNIAISVYTVPLPRLNNPATNWDTQRGPKFTIKAS